MSESLRNDGRIWVPKKKEDAEKLQKGLLKPTDIKEEDRDYYLERRYPAFGNLVPRDVASRAAKERSDEGFGVNNTGLAVYLDFSDSIKRLGKQVIEERYGNLFQMYEKIVDEDGYIQGMMIYPAVHYTMGGLWVDYHLMTSIPGLFCAGEANFSDHGANRLGASALMQGLADGYFVIPYTVGDYLATEIKTPRFKTDSQEFEQAHKEVSGRIEQFFSINGNESVDSFHKKLGKIMWENVGMGRNENTLKNAIKLIPELRNEFWKNLYVPGKPNEFNQELEKAGRVADFLELGELMALDALNRKESCGGHFREESQTEEGEALRHDDQFSYVAAWEYKEGVKFELHTEPLKYEVIQVQQRNYK
jgi:succinate dehydrogenase / fumarate reductase flavoprotein subunit